MRIALRPYQEYKDTGLDWLNSVPAHWEVRSLGSILTRKSERNRPDLPLLSVLREKGVVLRSALAEDENRNVIPDDLSNYQVVQQGNVVINKMKAWQGSLGISGHDGLVSPAYFVFYCSLPERSHAHWLLRSKIWVAFFAQASDGVRIGQWDLSMDRMKRIPVLVPPLEEQRAIARFLDYMDRRVRRLIRAKRRLIELLNEQKQAIIHRAVTRGLDPNVRLKPSGVDWLGDIPEQWEIAKLSHVALVANGTTPSRMRTDYWHDGEVPWLSSGKVNDYIVEAPSEYVTDKALHECALSLLPKGAVIIGMIGQGRTRGMSARLAIDACINQNLAAIVPQKKRLDPRFLHHVLTSMYGPIRELGRGSNQAALNCEIISSLRLPLPSLSEQIALATSLDTAVDDVSRSIRHVQREIELVREFRTRLITDVVTGKLDVRGVDLPDEHEAPEDWDERVEDEMEDVSEEEEVEFADA